MNVNDKKAVKAGFWYTICRFLIKGLAFLTTPFFTRMMTVGEYGEFSNIQFWLNILAYATGLELYYTVMVAKHDHSDDIPAYTSSILTLSVISTVCVTLIIFFMGDGFYQITSIKRSYLPLISLYLIGDSAFSIMQTRHRAFYRYKMYTLMTLVYSVLATGLSLFLVYILPENRVFGRLCGIALPLIALGLVLVAVIYIQGKSVKPKYWKYALHLSLPLVVNTVCISFLSSSSRTIINRYCGPEFTALFSLAVSVQMIVSQLYQAMNSAWAPWVQDRLHETDYEKVRGASRKFLLLFIVIIAGVVLLAPEFVLILGGREYYDSINLIPTLLCACIFQFIYSMMMNVEIYYHKTLIAAVSTAIAATLNVGISILLIPRFGYLVSGYVTAGSYFILMLMHYFMSLKLGIHKIYDIRSFFVMVVCVVTVMAVMPVVYNYMLLRYGLVLLLGVAGLLYGYKNLPFLKSMLSKK